MFPQFWIFNGLYIRMVVGWERDNKATFETMAGTLLRLELWELDFVQFEKVK